MERDSTSKMIAPAPSKARLENLLSRSLPKQLVEVLIPAMRWRIGKRQITVIACNPLWEDIFRQHGMPIVERYGSRHDLAVRLLSSQESSEHIHSRRQRFNTFIQDPGNEFPLSSARQIIDEPGMDHNPLYIHGPSGCGKSHLLRAITAECRDAFGPETAIRITGDDWVSHWAVELAESDQGELAQQLREAVIICIDDVERLSERELAQEQLYHIINQALDLGQQIVVAGNQQPRHLPAMQDRVTSRLSWGLVVGMETPLVETRLALLKQLAGQFIDDSESSQLAEIVEALAPDMHQVIALADRYARGEVVAIGEDKTSLDTVIEIVAKHADLRPGDLAGKRRHRPVSEARQTAMLLARRLTGHSLEALGGMIGGRDHSTVMYLIRQAEERLDSDADYRLLITRLTQDILRSELNPSGR